ncbi:MAG: hypothetical protein HQM12_19585 [SAR324 cluster bacterium]|nr:hypothetical protein [SAR324 cluster bacterium]
MKSVLLIIKATIIGAILYYIIQFAIDSYQKFPSGQLNINYYLFGFAIFLGLLATFNYSLIWHYITLKNQCSISVKSDAIIWFLAEMGKFIPGKIFLIAGKLYFYNKAGKSKTKIAFCFYVEILCSSIAALLIFLLSLILSDLEMLNQFRVIAVLLVLMMFIMIYPRLVERTSNYLLRFLGKPPIIFELQYHHLLQIIILYTINFVIFGSGLYFLISSVYPLSPSHIPYVSGSFAMAGIIGMISLFAPSGVGVREGVLIFALKMIVPDFIAALSSVLARVWATGAELILVLLVLAYIRFAKLNFSLKQ